MSHRKAFMDFAGYVAVILSIVMAVVLITLAIDTISRVIGSDLPIFVLLSVSWVKMMLDFACKRWQ